MLLPVSPSAEAQIRPYFRKTALPLLPRGSVVVFDQSNNHNRLDGTLSRLCSSITIPDVKFNNNVMFYSFRKEFEAHSSMA